MLSRIIAIFKAELTDPAVKRGIIVVISMIGIKHGLDQVHADELAVAIWAFVTVGVSRMPGKDKS